MKCKTDYSEFSLNSQVEQLIKMVALYARVSTEEQARYGLSIQDQVDALVEYAKKHGITNYEIYVDDGVSARKNYKKRPQLMRLLSDVRAGKIETILFTKLDRWTRNIAYFYEIQKILDANGVEWHTILEDYSNATPSDVFKLNVMLSAGQHEAEETAARVKFTLAQKRKRGEWTGGKPPIGYTLKDGKVVKDPATVDAMTAFFDTLKTTYSMRLAMDAAAANGLKLRQNTAYNYIRFGEKRYCGTAHSVPAEPYLTVEELEQIKKNLKSMTKTKSERIYLFSGLVRCSDCGARFIAAFGKNMDSGKGTKLYRCGQRLNSNLKGCKNGVYMSEKSIEKDLLENIEKYLQLEEIRLKAKEEQSDDAEIKRKRTSLDAKKERLTDAFLDGIIEKEVFRERMAEIEKEIDALPKPEPKKRITEKSSAIFEGWQDLYTALDEQNRQTFWRQIIDTIWINPDRTISVDFILD